MVSPSEIDPIPPAPQPTVLPIEEDQSYSKCGVVMLFLAILPALILWTALLILCLPLILWNFVAKCLGCKQIHCINALYKEYYTVLALAIRYPCSKKYHYTAGEGKPILLIHGYLHNASAWYSMIDRLQEERMGPIYAIDLGDGSLSGKFWSIHRYAQQVLEKTQQIAAETGRTDIAFVGHSMGGLVGIRAASLMPAGTVTDVITLGTPINGAPLAGCIGIGAPCREMTPGSQFITDVQHDLQTTSHRIRYHHIGSETDELVSASRAVPGTASEDNVIFEDLGHACLLNSGPVGDKVCEWLGSSRC